METALLSILKIIPYIAMGISTVHSDLSVSGKQAAANDALQIALAGAQALLPANDSAIAGQVANVASVAMNSTILALHPSTTTLSTSTTPASQS